MARDMFRVRDVIHKASVEIACSIIVNETHDYYVIKDILAVVTYLKSKDAGENASCITALIDNKENLEAAEIAGEGKATVFCFSDMLTRIIVNTCRQPGMSTLLIDMLRFSESEFYFENFPELTGKQFGDVLNLFGKTIAIGLHKDGVPIVNPPMNTIIGELSDFSELARYS